MRSLNLEPVQRSEDGCDIRRFRSFNHGACKTVLYLLEAMRKSNTFPFDAFPPPSTKLTQEDSA